ncbi:GNAT family N-acetyltransferase [Actinomadura sp. DC4]|uniref:GNAT family N-acetyltransferase n=1 Tax=Actinomadura sp. DC4 TaxID=3055069 RepID=UPI0025B26248|nr:GNAT family N-acetyltransferase [Actinomadura sp. DC4]MDN3356943.1 GNAT family N-acetyltransferase [Actinomadura sp. DC4]
MAQRRAALEKFLAGRPSRVTLRPLCHDDQDEFLELVAVSAELHHPWMSLPATAEAFQAYVARYTSGDEESLLVRVRDSSAIAGIVNINSVIRGRYQNASLGYAAFAPSAGRGYLSEGLDLVVRYAFEELRLHRLDAQIQSDNVASLRLVKRLGFRNEGYSPDLLFIDGEWRDHERWAITSAMVDIAPTAPHPTLPSR